jgi:hypothetical protein
MHVGPEVDVRVATRAEAEEHWQDPLHAGWKVANGSRVDHARKYGPKASEKIAETMREFKRGELRSSSGQKVTSRKQAIAIGISQARRAGGKVPPQPQPSSQPTKSHSTVYRSKYGYEPDAWQSGYEYGLEAAGNEWGEHGRAFVRETLAQLKEGARTDFDRGQVAGYEKLLAGGGPVYHHAAKKKYPYIAYWVHTRGRGGRESEAIYVLGTTTRADEGIVGHDLRVRPLRLGKGPYTMVVSPDDVEDTP